jgi:hypothetical protein
VTGSLEQLSKWLCSDIIIASTLHPMQSLVASGVKVNRVPINISCISFAMATPSPLGGMILRLQTLILWIVRAGSNDLLNEENHLDDLL